MTTMQSIDKNEQLLMQLLIMNLQKQLQPRLVPQDRKRVREEEPSKEKAMVVDANHGTTVPREAIKVVQALNTLMAASKAENDDTNFAADCCHRQKRHRSTSHVHVIPSAGVFEKSAGVVAKERKNNDRKERLRDTSFRGDGEKIIKMLVKSGADGIVDALSSACKEGNAPVVKYLLKHHGPCLVDTPCRIGFVQELLRDHDSSGTKSSDVIDVTRCVGWTHVHTACYLGHSEIAKILLENKANVKSMTGNRWTPLHCACYRGHRDIVRLLLEHGSDGKTATTGTHTKDSTPLHCACHKGHVDIVELLLEKDAGDMTASTSHGWTPLHCACHNGHFDIVTVLLAKGADVSVTNAKGSTPFHCACYNGHLGIAALLLGKKEAHVDAIDRAGRTALQYACLNGQLHVATFLLMNGAQVNLQDGRGYTALHLACISGKLDVVKFLLGLFDEKRVDVSIADHSRSTPLHSACQKKHFAIVKVLLEAIMGMGVNSSEQASRAPLQNFNLDSLSFHR